MKTIKKEAVQRIIFSNYDIDSYYEDARQILNDSGLEDPSESQISDEVYELMSINFNEEFNNLKNFFGDIPVIAEGRLQRWNGIRSGFSVFDNFLQMWHSMTKDCDYYEIYDCNGHLYIKCSHHDGTNLFEVRKVTKPDASPKSIKKYYTRLPNYVHLEFGCPKIQYM